MSMPAEAATEYAFAAPPGFSIPEDVQEGQPFEVVAKIRLNGDQLVFDEINGVQLAAGESTPDEDEGGMEYENEDGSDMGDETDDLAAVASGM